MTGVLERIVASKRAELAHALNCEALLTLRSDRHLIDAINATGATGATGGHER